MAENGKDSPTLEPATSETVATISTTVNEKLDNPAVIRQDPDRGTFVLNDADQNGHSGKTEIEVDRNDNWVLLRFIEGFDEVTPRSKPSVLVYDYEIDEGTMRLLLDDLDQPDDDHGPLAIARCNQLKLDSIVLPSEDSGELPYMLSEPHAQKVLSAVKEMKVFIR